MPPLRGQPDPVSAYIPPGVHKTKIVLISSLVVLVFLCLLGIIIYKKVSPHISQPINWIFLSATSTPHYLVQNSQIIYVFNGANQSVISGADVSTFEIPTNTDFVGLYAKDKDHVYCEDKIILEADPKTFTYLVYDPQGSTTLYSEDATHVYDGCKLLPDANPATFSIFPNGGQAENYAKDSQYVYFNGFKIVGADPKSFVLVEADFSKDNTHAWDGAEEITNADPQTFVPVYDSKAEWTGFVKDKNHVYDDNPLNGYEIFDHADPASFVVLEQSAQNGFYEYIKDKNNIYYQGSAIQGADPLTFQIIQGNSVYDAQDKNHKYFEGQIVQ